MQETPLFADADGYAGLSEMARHYIGGLLHARARPAGPGRPDHQQLSPPGARLRGADQPGLLAAQPLGLRAHPDVLEEPEGQAHRVPRARPVVQPVSGLRGAADGRPGRRAQQDRAARAGGRGHLRAGRAEEKANIRSTPGSLAEVLDALEADHEFLLQGDVFTEDLIDTWIDYKREHELQPVQMRPHPYEFFLYSDV